MNKLKEWFDEASKMDKVFSVGDEDFIIYKGFKITQERDGHCKIQDTRFSNMYTSITKTCLKMFEDIGFIKGADTISLARNIQRVETYKKKTGLLYDKRRRCKNELPTNTRINEKRIRNINTRIQDYVDLIFLYQTRIQQFNFKYNKDE